jgi:hypothetical protein
MAPLLIRREADALFSFCLAGLIAPIGGSFYVGQTTFLTGWFPPFFKMGHFSSYWRFSKSNHRARSSGALSSSGVAH